MSPDGERRGHGSGAAYGSLLAAVLTQGVSGLAGGLGLVADPSGGAVGLPLTWLDGTPFSDYLVPGLILSSVLGAFPLLVAGGLWRRRRWAWHGSLVVGAALVTWVLVEILMIGYVSRPPLQAIYGLLGLLIPGLALAPRVRRQLS